MYKFKFEEFFWVAETRLDVWAGFRGKDAWHRKIGTNNNAGEVEIIFAPEARGEEPLSTRELELIQVFIDTHVEQAAAVLSGLFDGYEEIQKDFEDKNFGDPYWPRPPAISKKDDLRSIIQLETIHIHQIESFGAFYVGYELYCPWDEEHGLGILIHKDRVIEIGDSDSANSLSIVERDVDRI